MWKPDKKPKGYLTNNSRKSRKQYKLTIQTFTSSSRRMWNPHNGYMGFIQHKSWGCLQGALTNWKAQQQAAGQRKSLDPLAVHIWVSHRKGTLVEVPVRVWMAKTTMRKAWIGTWKGEVRLNLEIPRPLFTGISTQDKSYHSYTYKLD